jgi:HEAT repeat protein
MQYRQVNVRITLVVAGAAVLSAWTPAPLQARSTGAIRAGAVPADGSVAVLFQQDPADSLYRAGRAALNRGRYRDAVVRFRSIRRLYPRSAYAVDSYYWEAFALDRLGSGDDFRTALALLEQQKERYERAATLRDAQILATRIRGKMARTGDARAAERVARDAYRASGVAVAGTVGDSALAAGLARGVQGVSEDDELKMAALNALLMMDAERAVPLLIDLVRQRDVAPEIRQRALMVLGQQGTPESEEVLLDVLQNDPDDEVRGMALVFLSQFSSDRAIDVIGTILATSDDPELQRRAIIALAQRDDARATNLMRSVVERQDVDEELKVMAIMMLGQHSSPESQAFLRDLYARVDSPEIKVRIIHALAVSDREENRRWLLDIALDPNEPAETRKQAIFSAGQTGAIPSADLIALYEGTDDEELRHHLLFVLSQQKDPAAIDKMIDIARTDPDPEVRQRAIIWLAQSKDPRVADLLVEIIKK